MKATIVFAGPTIAAEEIKQHLPHAWIHAPIQSGDILRVLRLQPARLIIIDGYYEKTAAVWHKEILLALHEGVDVIGCASLGALRAAELNAFGMRGIGKIYNWYQNQVISDDDEVAVLHLDDSHDYQEMNEPLVNIRATLQLANQQGVISRIEEEAILQQARKLFYPQRHYEIILAQAEASFQQSLQGLRQWLGEHRVNQKHLDAIEALQWAASHQPTPPTPFMLQHTVYLKRLLLQCNASPFAKAYDWLPEDEQKVQKMPLPVGIQSLTVMMNLIGCLSQSEASLVSIGQWLVLQKKRMNFAPNTIKTANTLLQNFFPELSFATIEVFSLGFLVLDGLLTEKSIYCKNELISHYRGWLLTHLGLKDKTVYEQWLSRNNLQEEDLRAMIKKLARYRFAYHYFLGLFIQDIHIQPKNWLLVI